MSLKASLKTLRTKYPDAKFDGHLEKHAQVFKCFEPECEDKALYPSVSNFERHLNHKNHVEIVKARIADENGNNIQTNRQNMLEQYGQLVEFSGKQVTTIMTSAQVYTCSVCKPTTARSRFQGSATFAKHLQYHASGTFRLAKTFDEVKAIAHQKLQEQILSLKKAHPTVLFSADYKISGTAYGERPRTSYRFRCVNCSHMENGFIGEETFKKHLDSIEHKSHVLQRLTGQTGGQVGEVRAGEGNLLGNTLSEGFVEQDGHVGHDEQAEENGNASQDGHASHDGYAGNNIFLRQDINIQDHYNQEDQSQNGPSQGRYIHDGYMQYGYLGP